MKCSNCGREIDDNSAFCNFCGNKIEIKKEVEEEQVEEKKEDFQDSNETPANIQEEENPVNNTEEENILTQENVNDESISNTEGVKKVVNEYSIPNKKPTDKKKRHSIITIVLAIIIIFGVIFGIGFGAYSYLTNTSRIYKNIVKNAVEQLYDSEKINYNSISESFLLEFNTDIEDLSTFNNLSIELDIGYDKNEKQALINANISQNNNSYLDGGIYLDILNQTLYIAETNLYNKTISMELSDDIVTQINTYLDEYSNDVDEEVLDIVTKKLYLAINNNLDDSYFSKEKIDINVNGKSKKVNSYVMTITVADIEKMTTNIVEDLKSDTEFLECFEDETEIVSILENFEDEIYEIFDGTSDTTTLTFSIYTSGILNTFMGANLQIYSPNDETIVEICGIKSNSNVYDLTVNSYYEEEMQEIITGTITFNESEDLDMTLVLNKTDTGSVSLRYKLQSEYNGGIGIFDTSNVIDVTELSEDDLLEIYGNLLESPLYSIAEELAYLSIETEVTTTSTDESYVKTNSGNITVIYNIPSTFEESYSGNTYRTYRKYNESYNSAYIYVTTKYSTIEEYEEYIQKLIDSYADDENYVTTISGTETVEIGNETYYKIETTHTYLSGSTSLKYSSVYYFLELDDDYILSVEVDDSYNIVTQNELNKFLTIEIK